MAERGQMSGSVLADVASSSGICIAAAKVWKWVSVQCLHVL